MIVTAVVLCVALLAAQAYSSTKKTNSQDNEEAAEEKPLLIWYTDPDIQDYVEAAAKEFAAESGTEVQTELVSEVDYIETISERSMAEEMTGPDLYVASTTLLEKAALAGLTTEVTDKNMEETYSEKAVHAVTYNGTVEARPFYIETCVLLYNQDYVSEEEVPSSIEDILTYAENFEADETTEKVENIFQWNVADVIDDYMFLGAYTELGGQDGDDKSQVSMDLEKAEACMEYYQSLNGFFAIDADTVNSEEIVQDFVEGKTVFIIANVPMLAMLDQAAEEPFYQVELLPALTDELDSRGLSVTNSVVVNPYSTDTEQAEACARYLTEGRAAKLYEEAGKLPACESLTEGVPEEMQTVYTAYEQAAEVPKIMELSDMWLRLEVVLADIWRGEDPGENLEGFLNVLQEQLN
jgi:maltose-binding protein MalE